MRANLKKDKLVRLFTGIEACGISKLRIVAKLGVAIRTFNDWKNGKTTMPIGAFQFLAAVVGVKEREYSPRFLPDYWHAREAAKKGAYRRMALYGNFGTAEGRRKGGINSLKTHIKNSGSFKTLKAIKLVKKSEKLAELMGIIIGDGHLSQYQLSVTTNSVTDKKHAVFTRKLIENLFGVTTSQKNKVGENTTTTIVSSKALVGFLNKMGMPIGNKIKNNLTVPNWIFQRRFYKKFFLRGLFDTDGCVYLDTHRNGSKEYKTLGWTITSYAANLRVGVITILKELGYSPTYRTSQKSVFLRRKDDVVRYFKDVGTDNPKHYLRYQKFIGKMMKRS